MAVAGPGDDEHPRGKETDRERGRGTVAVVKDDPDACDLELVREAAVLGDVRARRLPGQQRVQRGQLGEVPRGRVQQADHVRGLVEQALRVVAPSRWCPSSSGSSVYTHWPVQTLRTRRPSVAAGAGRRGLAEHDPPAGAGRSGGSRVFRHPIQ